MREFANKVVQYINENTEFEASVSAKDMPDGTQQFGVTIKRPGDNIAPTIYVDSFCEKAVETAAMEMIKCREEAMIDMPDVEFFKDYEQVKDKLVVRLMPSTFKAEVSRSAKAYGFEDLILVPYVEVPDMNGSIKVNEEHVKSWGVDKRTVLDAAVSNTKKEEAYVKSLTSFMATLTPFDVEGEVPEGPIIVSNKNKVFGASAILGRLKELKKANPGGFFVLPSSVHEVLVMPKEFAEKDALDQMVKEVNRSAVDPTEWLADHAYEF